MSKDHAEAPSVPVGDSRDPRFWSAKKRNRYGWMIASSLLVLMMISWADKAVLGLAAVPLMKDLNITPAQFGLVGSAMFLTFGISQFIAAPFVNKLPTKWILLVLCLLWSVAQVPVLLFASLPALWTSRLLLGAGEGPLAPVLMHGVYKWFPAKKGATPAALASAGVTLGIVAFAPVIAWIISAFGWQTAFGVLAVTGLVWGAFWLVAGKEGPFTSMAAEREMAAREPGAEAEAAAAVSVLVETRVPFWKTIVNPSWIFAVMTSFFGYWTFTMAMSWGPAYFQSVMGFSSQQAGSLIALPAAWGFVSTVALSALTQRLVLRGVPTRKARGWVLGGAAAFGGATLLAATFSTIPALTLTLLVFGFGTAPALFAISYLVVAELTTFAQRGAHLTIANAVLTAGGVFAPAVAGFIIGGAATPAAGYKDAFALTAVLLLGCGILSLFFINQQRERRRLGLDVPDQLVGAPVAGKAEKPASV